MKYTPRQMYFMLELVNQRKVHETHAQLSLMALAAQGDSKSIRAQLRALKKQMK